MQTLEWDDDNYDRDEPMWAWYCDYVDHYDIPMDETTWKAFLFYAADSAFGYTANYVPDLEAILKNESAEGLDYPV